MDYFVFGEGNSYLFTNDRFKLKLKENGLIRTRNPLFCQLIICRSIEIAKIAGILFPFKKIVVHQTELFVDTTRTNRVCIHNFKTVAVINGFNEGIFFNNYHFLSSYIYDDEFDLGLKKGQLISTSEILSKKEFKSAKPVIFIGQKRPLAEINENNSYNCIDLNIKRQEIAQCAFDKGVGDVIGRGWNEISGIKNSGFDSGFENWWDVKLELIKGYRFNIAFENTLWKYYVTEKIWHSIKAGSLPIYWGQGSSIYESFPKNSFIDASDFKNSTDLIDYITNLTYDLWYLRMEKCIKVYNDSIIKMNYSKLDEAISKIIERIY
jgi:hypothetical protein